MISMSGWRGARSVGNRPPRLLAISDGRSAPGQAFSDWVGALAASEVDALQLREKRTSDATVYGLALEAGAARGDLRVLVNGRADIALAAGLDGVHLPSSGVPVELVRKLLGPTALVGCSTHHADEVARAADRGADYVTFGPVYRTPSKEAYGPPPGLAGLERAAAHGLPVLALGGITMERARECAAAGAYGIAGIRLFARPGDLVGLADLFAGQMP